MPQIDETFTIGDLVRKEIEVAQGSTLEISLAVPGGTSGKSFTSQFQHSTYVSPAVPAPVAGVDLAGAFTVTVLDSQRVLLSTPTSSLLPGKYYYEVKAQLGLVTSLSSLREFVVLASLSGGATGGTVQPIDPGNAAALVSQHNLDPLAHGGKLQQVAQSQSFSFAQADLSNTSGILVKLHTLPSKPSTVTVYDDNGLQVRPAETFASATSFSCDLFDFVPIVGTWLAIVSV